MKTFTDKPTPTFGMNSQWIGLCLISRDNRSVGRLHLEQLGAHRLGEGLGQAQEDTAQVQGEALTAVCLTEQLWHAGPQLRAAYTQHSSCAWLHKEDHVNQTFVSSSIIDPVLVLCLKLVADKKLIKILCNFFDFFKQLIPAAILQSSNQKMIQMFYYLSKSQSLTG